MRNGAQFRSAFLPYEDTANFSLYYHTNEEDAEAAETLLRDYMSELAFNVLRDF